MKKQFKSPSFVSDTLQRLNFIRFRLLKTAGSTIYFFLLKSSFAAKIGLLNIYIRKLLYKSTLCWASTKTIWTLVLHKCMVVFLKHKARRVFKGIASLYAGSSLELIEVRWLFWSWQLAMPSVCFRWIARAHLIITFVLKTDPGCSEAGYLWPRIKS